MFPESRTTDSCRPQKRPLGRPRRSLRNRLTCYVPEQVEQVLRDYSAYIGIPLTDAVESAVTAYVPYMKSTMSRSE